jgi:RNA polymerase sigma factor (TIGR02999 family)
MFRPILGNRERRSMLAQASTSELEALFERWRNGESAALNALCAQLYPDLKKIAIDRLRGQTHPLLQATALVNEGFAAVLARFPNVRNAQHLTALVALSMRSVLVDFWRAESANKRGNADAKLTLGFLDQNGYSTELDLLGLEQALTTLETDHPRAAQCLIFSSFGGLGNVEIADLVGVNERTIERDLRYAKAFIASELGI